MKTKLLVLQKVFEQQNNSKVISTPQLWTLEHLRPGPKTFSSWWTSPRGEQTNRLWLWLSREDTGSFGDGRIDYAKNSTFFKYGISKLRTNNAKKIISNNFWTNWLIHVEERTPITHFRRYSLCSELSWIDYRNLQKIIEVFGIFGISKRRREERIKSFSVN